MCERRLERLRYEPLSWENPAHAREGAAERQAQEEPTPNRERGKNDNAKRGKLLPSGSL